MSRIQSQSQPCPSQHPMAQALAFEDAPVGRYSRGGSRKFWDGIGVGKAMRPASPQALRVVGDTEKRYRSSQERYA